MKIEVLFKPKVFFQTPNKIMRRQFENCLVLKRVLLKNLTKSFQIKYKQLSGKIVFKTRSKAIREDDLEVYCKNCNFSIENKHATSFINKKAVRW